MSELVSIVRISNTQFLASLQQQGASWITPDSIRTILSLLYVLVGTGFVLFLGGYYLTNTRFFRRIVLSDVQATHQGYTARTYPDSLIGLQGTTQTPLRPAGKVMIGGVYYDVKTLGTYVASGATVVVTAVSGTSLTVQAIHQV